MVIVQMKDGLAGEEAIIAECGVRLVFGPHQILIILELQFEADIILSYSVTLLQSKLVIITRSTGLNTQLGTVVSVVAEAIHPFLFFKSSSLRQVHRCDFRFCETVGEASTQKCIIWQHRESHITAQATRNGRKESYNLQHKRPSRKRE